VVRQEAAQRAVVSVRGLAARVARRLDVLPGTARACALPAGVGEQHDEGERELQHSPHQGKRPESATPRPVTHAHYANSTLVWGPTLAGSTEASLTGVCRRPYFVV